MERLQTGESVRFTPAQRDALLDMASRLQAEHEATIEVGEIARAAAEAGIDPRFVQEAVLRMESPVEEKATFRAPLVAAIVLGLLNFIFLTLQARAGNGFHFTDAKVPLLFIAAFLFATVAVRPRTLRWIVPVGIFASWVSLSLVFAIYMKLTHQYVGFLPVAGVLPAALCQTLAGVVAAGLASFQDRTERRQSPVRY